MVYTASRAEAGRAGAKRCTRAGSGQEADKSCRVPRRPLGARTQLRHAARVKHAGHSFRPVLRLRAPCRLDALRQV